MSLFFFCFTTRILLDTQKLVVLKCPPANCNTNSVTDAFDDLCAKAAHCCSRPTVLNFCTGNPCNTRVFADDRAKRASDYVK